jgi:hypothetical protein
MTMSAIDIHGCPPPQNITLVARLTPLIGKTVSVFTPGFPKLTKTTGKLSHVNAVSFQVGPDRVFMNTSFFIVLRTTARTVKPFDITATAEDMGTIKGKLIRVGRDFVELVQTPGKDVPTLFPLNMFTEVTCEREHEE